MRERWRRWRGRLFDLLFAVVTFALCCALVGAVVVNILRLLGVPLG